MPHNSISSSRVLLCLIFISIAACTQKATTRVHFHAAPPAPDDSPKYTRLNKASPRNIVSDNLIQEKTPFESKAVKQHHNLWQRLFSLYQFPEVENDRIEKKIQFYLKHPRYLETIQSRAEPYLYHIINVLEEKNLPGELAFLPAVESAFKPQALSNKYASGLWQFIPSTGRLFGLRENFWFDGRNDILLSTDAATEYLKQLNGNFNDWFLALAAYNTGKGNVNARIRRNQKKGKPEDYWSLSLPRETMHYVPRLLALAKIYANAEKYNLKLTPISNQVYFKTATVNSQLDINIAAKLAEMPIKQFKLLNSGFKHDVIDPDSHSTVLIQADKKELFLEQLAKTDLKDRLKFVKHQIQSGENLGLIARKYGSRVDLIKQQNRLTSDRIRAGKYLSIPLHSAAIKQNPTQLYVVKKGDTFWDIARQFSVKSKDIAIWNGLSLSNILQPGQTLIIKKS